MPSTSQVNQFNFTLIVGDLIPEDQQLVSIKRRHELSYAINLMIQKNYSQLPVIDESKRLEGVISWRSIGKKGTGEQYPWPLVVENYMDTCVKAISLHISLFEMIQEIENRDYIVIEDDNQEVKGIVTASDLANRFGKFSRAFAYIGEIDLKLRSLIEDKLKRTEAIECALKGKYPECEGDDEANLGLMKRPDFGKYVRVLNSRPDILDLPDKSENIVCQVDKVRVIRNKVMHFKNGRLEEATDEDIRLLQVLLEKIRDV